MIGMENDPWENPIETIEDLDKFLQALQEYNLEVTRNAASVIKVIKPNYNVSGVRTNMFSRTAYDFWSDPSNIQLRKETFRNYGALD